MGKLKHEGKGRNISVSGGQERKDLFKDMSGGYNAMGDSNQPLYKYNGSVAQQRYSSATPLEGNAFGHAMQKAGGDYDKAKSMLEMKGHSSAPTYKKGCTSGSGSNAPYKKIGDPKKEAKKYLKSIKKDPTREAKLDSIQNVYNKQFDDFDMGSKVQGGEQDFDKNYNILKKAGRDTIFGMYGKKKDSPASLMGPTKGKPGKSMSKKMRKLPRKKVE